MSAATARKYAMTRIAAGDYLLPSNDKQTLWRIYSYEEDGSAEWRDSAGRWHKITGRFWATAKYNRPLPESGEVPYDFLDWENWTTWETNLKTQKLAIEATLR